MYNPGLQSQLLTNVSRATFIAGMGLSALNCAEILDLDSFKEGPTTLSAAGGRGGMGGAGGSAGGMGGSGGNSEFDGTPSISRPSNVTLTPTRAYLLWSDGELPPAEANKSISGYQHCFATGNDSTINGPDLCPNAAQVAQTFSTIDPLTASTQYFWKVRTVYDDDTFSDYSDISVFTTNASLFGWWRLDDNVGTTALDSSPSMTNGSLVNFDVPNAWTPGLINSALLFDATDDYVNLGNAYNFSSTDSFSIELWPRRNTGTQIQALFTHMDFTDMLLRRGYRLSYEANDTIRAQLRSSDAMGDFIDIATVQDYPVMLANPFQSVVMTYDGSLTAAGVKIYTSATEEAITVLTDNLTGPIVNPAPTWIGAQVDTDFLTPNRVIDGAIDEVAIYNTALTPEQVVNNYCAVLTQSAEDPSAFAPCTP